MFQLSGRGHPPAAFANASLVIIDAQREYLSGPLALSGINEAVENIAKLLKAARAANRPIVHVRHLGTVGGLFDPQGDRGKFIPGLEPQGDEPIIEKNMPNAFNNTRLHETLQSKGHVDLIVCGFMTHSSISTTVRAAKDYGYRSTLVEDACATRDLPYKGGILPAETVKQVGMATMADNFASVALTADLI
jgi:nicotinamidase-related amidase